MFLYTTDFCYRHTTFKSSTIITPGTENNADITRVNQFMPIVIGRKYDIAPTAHIAPKPPKALVNSALKKLLLILKITNAIIVNNPTKT